MRACNAEWGGGGGPMEGMGSDVVIGDGMAAGGREAEMRRIEGFRCSLGTCAQLCGQRAGGNDKHGDHLEDQQRRKRAWGTETCWCEGLDLFWYYQQVSLPLLWKDSISNIL